MSEPTTVPATPPSSNGPPESDADARLSRIESALAVLAAQQVAGPPPEGFSRPGSPPQPSPNPLNTLKSAVEVAQMAGKLPGGQKSTKAWMKLPVIRELLMVFWLYVDKRYSPTRAAQLGVPAIIVLLVLSALYFNLLFQMPIVSQIIEYLIAMVLAVVLFQILTKEVTRYAAVLEYLSKTGRG